MINKTNSNRVMYITRLRQDGYSYQEIADTIGVSRQRVHQIISAKKPPKKIQKAEQYKYPYLYKKIIEKYRSVSAFAIDIDCSYETIQHMLRGQTSIHLDLALRISDLFGEDVRVLFAEKPNCK